LGRKCDIDDDKWRQLRLAGDISNGRIFEVDNKNFSNSHKKISPISKFNPEHPRQQKAEFLVSKRTKEKRKLQ
jgi:hypothetical protein